ncbi:MAG: nicotinamide mononucleotide transporter [Clostridia bacterium]|nr:nicotinamide mononucleotide transporter [Clostridia bacterium]
MRKSNSKSFRYQNYQRNLINVTTATNIGINNHDRLVKAYGSTANRIEVLNMLRKQSKFTIYWFIIFGLLGIACLVIDINGWFQVFDLYLVMVNIYLVARGKLIGIALGIVECCIYAFICFKSQLFGEVIKVMCISVPLNIFSLISWKLASKKKEKDKFNTKKDDDVVIRKLNKKLKLVFGGALVGCSGLAFLLLKFVIGQENALLLSSIALAITIVGKILTARKYVESYILFLCGNIICLLMWGQTMIESGVNLSDLSMTVYYLACFSFDVYAYELWKSMYRRVAINGGVILAKRKVKITRIIKLRRRYKNLHWNKEVDVAKNS